MFKNIFQIYLYIFLLEILMIQIHWYSDLQAGMVSKNLNELKIHYFVGKRKTLTLIFGSAQAQCYECDKC